MTKLNDGVSEYNKEAFRPLKRKYVGQVVANDDPKCLFRVKVEIPRLTKGLKVNALPWYPVRLPLGLGSSTYTSHVAIPQVNTLVYVEFDGEDIYSGEVVGGPLNRASIPNDKMNLSADYLAPKGSEHHFTKDWVSKAFDDSKSGAKHFSPNFVEDYPFSWGWVDNAMNWFKVNLMKRTTEFVLNNFLKFKTFANGDTVIHIPGNLQVVIEKDLYLEVRGNTDMIFYNSAYTHVIGNHIHNVEHLYTLSGKRGVKVNGKNIVLS